ncbi:hypothetical protein [Roseobacter phage RDJL6]|nr:hypothetical protein [Roseobacter phage RDJL6]
MSYFGLCIGGPLDGHYRNWNTPSFETPADRPGQGALNEPTDCSTASLSFSVTRYTHSPWRVPGSSRTFDLWLHEGLSLEEALTLLLDGYSRGRNWA